MPVNEGSIDCVCPKTEDNSQSSVLTKEDIIKAREQTMQNNSNFYLVPPVHLIAGECYKFDWSKNELVLVTKDS